jgi:hypothetical protein
VRWAWSPARQPAPARDRLAFSSQWT